MKVAWIADYFDQYGERHIKTHRTKREAEDWLAAGHAVPEPARLNDISSHLTAEVRRLVGSALSEIAIETAALKREIGEIKDAVGTVNSDRDNHYRRLVAIERHVGLIDNATSSGPKRRRHED